LTTDFSGKKTFYLPLLSYLAENQPGVHQFYLKQNGREKCIAENVLVDIVTRSWESLSG
jgi:TM2 domain-containing membrane protein YozV